MLNIIDELEWRDAINQQTDAEGLRELTNTKAISLYCGVDPTGDSMHIGHLIPFMMLKRFQLAGHRPVILIGGATYTIGDPSGRQSERSLQTMEQVQENVAALTAQMKRLFVTDGDNQVRMVNNYDWTKNINVIEFLRDYGKNFSINTMLAKDVVSSLLTAGFRSPNSPTRFCSRLITCICTSMRMCSCRSAALTNGAISRADWILSVKRRQRSQGVWSYHPADAQIGWHQIRQNRRGCRVA